MPHRHPSLLAAPAAARGRLWLTNAKLIDGTGGATRERAAVLITDGAIERVGSASEPTPDSSASLSPGL